MTEHDVGTRDEWQAARAELGEPPTHVVNA